ncbi:hypothetical protein [Solirubrobacter soli]|uniref:hypothetical protein n=1 Tax=Solirubrobacter soli TaxID=363832 RepID=UPI000423A610|nr:hypothetical protein [Solirubrobacter soli]
MPILTGLLVNLAASFLFTLVAGARLALRAVVPLTCGLVAAAGAVVAYVLALEGEPLGDFFSSAAQVGIGVLVALVVEQRIKGATGEPVKGNDEVGAVAASQAGGLSVIAAAMGAVLADYVGRQARGGTVALAALGTLAALAGGLVDGADGLAEIARGTLFAVTWMGSVAGIVGLFIFIGPPAEQTGGSGAM